MHIMRGHSLDGETAKKADLADKSSELADPSRFRTCAVARRRGQAEYFIFEVMATPCAHVTLRIIESSRSARGTGQKLVGEVWRVTARMVQRMEHMRSATTSLARHCPREDRRTIASVSISTASRRFAPVRLPRTSDAPADPRPSSLQGRTLANAANVPKDSTIRFVGRRYESGR